MTSYSLKLAQQKFTQIKIRDLLIKWLKFFKYKLYNSTTLFNTIPFISNFKLNKLHLAMMRIIYYNCYSLFLMLTRVNSYLKSTISPCTKILENDQIKKYLIDMKCKSISIIRCISFTPHKITSKNQFWNNKCSTLFCIIFYMVNIMETISFFITKQLDHK